MVKYTLTGKFDDPDDSFFSGKLTIEGKKDTYHLGTPIEEFIPLNKIPRFGSITIEFIKDKAMVKEAENWFAVAG